MSEILKNRNYQRINPSLNSTLTTYTSDKKVIDKAIKEVKNSSQVKHELEQMAQQLISIYKKRN